MCFFFFLSALFFVFMAFSFVIFGFSHRREVRDSFSSSLFLLPHALDGHICTPFVFFFRSLIYTGLNISIQLLTLDWTRARAQQMQIVFQHARKCPWLKERQQNISTLIYFFQTLNTKTSRNFLFKKKNRKLLGIAKDEDEEVRKTRHGTVY